MHISKKQNNYVKKLFSLFAALTLSVGLWAENAFKIVNANGFQQPVNRVAQVISAYAGTTIRVVFHHQDYDNYFINIDNLGIECEPLAPVFTTFNVTVPEGTDACYLVGTLNSWNIGEPIEMTKLDDTHYTYTAEEDLTGAEYKYVHGASWDMVEKAADGSEMGDRVVNAEVMNDTVEKWADDDTALPNVNAKANANKFLHNGNIIIERNGIKYTTTGQKVR